SSAESTNPVACSSKRSVVGPLPSSQSVLHVPMGSCLGGSSDDRLGLLQGTLDMLVLRALVWGPLHGHAIAKQIERASDAALRVDHGSLYPALHRLKRAGWISATWEPIPDKNRQAKYYRLTTVGKTRLVSEESKWRRLVRAINSAMAARPL